MLTPGYTSIFLRKKARAKFKFAKKLFVLAVFSLITILSHAQKQKHREPLNPVKDRKEYQGYTIRLIPGQSGNSYGFDILQGTKLLVHQWHNPMPGRFLNKKDDTYKVATWYIKEYKKTGHWTSEVPPHIARELQLSNNINQPSKN